MIRTLAMLAIAAMLGGCALSEDVADVKYLPTKAALVANAQPVGLTVVDARTSDRNRISAKMNGFGMEMAAIRSTREVPDIVRDALKAEFEERGFHIEAGGRAVTVSIDRFYNQFGVGAFSGSADGDVSLTVTVADAGGAKLYTQSYAGTSKSSILMANGSNAAEAVAAALNDAIGKMFADPGFIAVITGAAAATKPVS